MAKRKSKPEWAGLDSIEPGDKIKWQNTMGVTCEAIVYEVVSRETISPEHGICLEFYSDRIKRQTGPDFFSFQRVVPEEWITHWKGRRIRSSGQSVRTVDSSLIVGKAQIELPLQEGGQ